MRLLPVLLILMVCSALAGTVRADDFDTLGIPRGADAQRIKKAYRKLSRKHHPDALKAHLGREPTAAEIDEAEAKFRKIRGAYETLSSPSADHETVTSRPRNWEDLSVDKARFKAVPMTREEFLRTAFGSLGGSGQSDSSDPRLESIIEEMSRKSSPTLLNRDDWTYILSLLGRDGLGTSAATRISQLIRSEPLWPPEVWVVLDKRFVQLRAGAPLYPLVDALQKQASWPESIEKKVRATLAPGLTLAITEAAAQNLRVSAVELSLSRAAPFPGTVENLERFLQSHHNSDLFKKTEALLAQLKEWSPVIDRLITEKMRGIFYNNAKLIPSFGPYPNGLMKLLMQRDRVPDGLWEMLAREAAIAPNGDAPISTLMRLADRFKVPEAATMSFFKNLGRAIDPLSPYHFENFGKANGELKPPLERLLNFECESKSCLEMVVGFANSKITSSDPIRIRAVEMLDGILGRHPEYLEQDIEFRERVKKVVSAAGRSYDRGAMHAFAPIARRVATAEAMAAVKSQEVTESACVPQGLGRLHRL